MKRTFTPFLAGLALCCAQCPVFSQEFQEHINKEFTLSKEAALSTLAIYNINGSLRVEGYSGDKILLEVEKTISAGDESSLDSGKKEFRLEFEQKEDSIIAYIAAPYDSRPHTSWNDDGHRHQPKYSFQLDFTVKVPFALNLAVSTVNSGTVMVQDVSGKLEAHNVNGGVTLTNVKGITDARTVNGSLTINYLSNPPGASSYRTINGDIKVSFQPDLSADLEFKSMHGEYYTDFPDLEVLPAMILKNQAHNGNGTVYQLNKNTAVRIRKGGNTFKFETLNGDIYIKKQS